MADRRRRGDARGRGRRLVSVVGDEQRAHARRGIRQQVVDVVTEQQHVKPAGQIDQTPALLCGQKKRAVEPVLCVSGVLSDHLATSLGYEDKG